MYSALCLTNRQNDSIHTSFGFIGYFLYVLVKCVSYQNVLDVFYFVGKHSEDVSLGCSLCCVV